MRFLVFLCLAAVAVSAKPFQEDDKVCEPGVSFKDDCNDCRCSIDGKSRICTMMMCLPKDLSLLREVRQISDDKPCTPGEKFMKYCNTCACGSDGLSVVCTRMACIKGMHNEDGSFKNPEQVPDKPLTIR